MGLPGLFIALSGATLVLALAALFRSLRAAFGDEDEAESLLAVDGAERGSLLEEKKSLLRALKDLEYEHAVGKMDDADFKRLNQAYRARARQVLSRLDDDLGAHRDAAIALLDRHVASAQDDEPGASTKKTKKKKKLGKSSRKAARVDDADELRDAGAATDADSDEGPSAKAHGSATERSETGRSETERSETGRSETERSETERSETEPVRELICSQCETKNDVDATFCKRCAARLAPGASDDSADDDSADDDSADDDADETDGGAAEDIS